MIRLVFLGKLADVAGADSLELPGEPEPLDWSGLTGALPAGVVEGIEAATTRVAQNGALLADKTALLAADGDEIAFLPPVSGG